MLVLILCPFILIVIYSAYLLVKKPSRDDVFFHLSRVPDERILENRITMLEEINGEDYSEEKEKIARFFEDRRITQAEADAIEKLFANTYFGGFKKKWIAFSKADPMLRMIFIICLVYGFFVCNLIFLEGVQKKVSDEYRTLVQVAVNITLVLPYLIGAVTFGLLGLIMQFFSMTMGDRGGVSRAAVICEELLKGLKPGGRKTQIVLNGRGPGMWTSRY